MQGVSKLFICFVLTLPILGCNQITFSKLKEDPFGSLKLRVSNSVSQAGSLESEKRQELSSIITATEPNISLDDGFADSLKLAVQSNPKVIAARQDYEAQLASLKFAKGDKDFQVSGTIYGGVEDITDETAGMAVVLNARRLLYDGGIIDNSISAEQLISKAAYQNIRVVMNESALEAATAWVQFERYRSLNDLIRSRLEVLDPLISQLEEVAKAGVGDKTQVAAAQRTVTMIRVAQSDVAERFELAKLNFKNLFGALPVEVNYDEGLISAYVPKKLNQDVILKSPGLVGGYEAYKAALARLEAIEAKGEFSVGFETKLQRPFGGSGYDSDESVGLVLRKTLYDGKKLEGEVERAKLAVNLQVSKLQAAYRDGKRLVEASQQTVLSLGAAMSIAADNANATAEEISFLRKQLVIGQSSLDSVLAAEARLYDAESKEIEFLADKRVAHLTILSTLGLLAPLIELE